ncbi:hypothetical protein [Aurantimonas sp. HBX-1]|uniref:hypothetical protein n=1 Tax=Aurantimonas sp. HBX-1 TaxID=2906072 RepID=UPI001F158353|nr:hypothetical protein [Aurantimonas sp. HBX-1]UIJ70555.1 hypothetical protein LXB15_12395 [Aurantimonas sp. HBX-1]
MIDHPDAADIRSPRFLIMDNTPLSLLGCIEALDWLFEPGCPVTITDMILAEATRDPGEDRDQRRGTRAYINAWLTKNRARITILETAEGARYDREMQLWERAGKPEDLRPSWSDRGERSLLAAIQVLKQALLLDEEIIVIVDDRDARDAVRAVRADLTMMGTRTFIRWMDEDFGVSGADTAWQAIRLATDGTADEGEDDDPVFVRSGS